MAKNSDQSLKPTLEAAFREYHHERERNLDPISLVYPYSNPQDREVVAFLIALISYGNVKTIIQSGKNILKPLDNSPYGYLTSDKPLDLWSSFKHRFTTGKDIEIVAYWLRSILKKEGSLEAFFVKKSGTTQSPMKEKLSSFVKGIWSEPLPKHLKLDFEKRKRNLKYLISDPEQGSACKRLNMFLRWVVRPQDGVDLGLWKQISTKELMLPIDTHLLQTLKKLRWIRSEQANWKTVEVATKRLREISDRDPIRYDFALCHLSMAGGDIKSLQKQFRRIEIQ